MNFLSAFIGQVIIYTTIYTLASLGIVLAGRTGIFNVSAEGIMLSSASVGFIAANLSGSWFVGFLAGFLIGALFGFILVYLHETFKVNQFILGISLVILGTGLSDLLYKLIMGVRLSAPTAPSTPIVNIPVLSNIPIVSSVLNHDVIVYFMYLAVVVSWWFLYRTKMGLETRAIGENPKSADVMGVNVLRRRYIATIIGAALIGIAGAYIPIVITKTYSPNISGGRGFMAIGIAIFASWKPQRAIIGGFFSLQLRLYPFSFKLYRKEFLTSCCLCSLFFLYC